MLLEFEHVDMPLVHHSEEVEFVSRLSDWLYKGTDRETLNLACCYRHKLFDSYYLVQDAE